MELKVTKAVQAVDIIVNHLRARTPKDAPEAGQSWQEKTLYAAGPQDSIVSSKLFTAADWNLEISQNFAPLARTVYQATMFNEKARLFWRGSVKADGSLAEEAPLKKLSAKESQEKSAELVKKMQVPGPRYGGYGH
jgi:hypothetical protein